MPKVKQKKQTVQIDDDGDDDGPTQGTSGTQDLHSEEAERRVHDLVQFLMIMDQKKHPIKRQDINKGVLKEYSKSFPAMMKKAKEKLRNVFGIDLVEVEGKGPKSYILVNMLDNDVDHPHLSWSEEDNSRMALLMVVLSDIFMNENVVTDVDLYHFLRKLGVDVDATHAVFGDVKKLLTKEFVHQKYLEYSLQPATEPPIHEFRWGQRAIAEATKRNVLDFVSQIYGESNPRVWTSQWADVMRSEATVNGDQGGTSNSQG